MQKRLSKKLPVLWIMLLSCFFSNAQTLSYHLAKADSLFQQKRYTQSMDLYQSIFQKKQYSPAMLLKMAYIEEGLDHTARSMYYLNLYYLVTKDDRAATKISELAAKNNLTGYELSDADRALQFYKDYHFQITLLLGSATVFLFSLIMFQRKRKKRPVALAAWCLLTGMLLLAHTNLQFGQQAAIVSEPNTYLMSGPSAGASVVRILGDGHRLYVTGEYDIWARVRWNDKDVYVKKDHLLPVSL
jgi:hypothetical protein